MGRWVDGSYRTDARARATYRPPDAPGRQYNRELQREIVDDLIRLTNERLVPELQRLTDQARTEQGYKDAADWRIDTAQAELDSIVSGMAAEFESAHPDRLLQTLASDAAERTNTFSQAQNWRVFGSAGFVTPATRSIALSPGQTAKVFQETTRAAAIGETWIRENVGLIKTISTRHFDAIRSLVNTNFQGGARYVETMKAIRERYGVTKHVAERIARDQTNKLNGQLNRARQQANDVEKFRWSTVGDARTREKHAHLGGKVFAWSQGHPTERFPGWPIQCRCTAEPIFPELGDSEQDVPEKTEAQRAWGIGEKKAKPKKAKPKAKPKAAPKPKPKPAPKRKAGSIYDDQPSSAEFLGSLRVDMADMRVGDIIETDQGRGTVVKFEKHGSVKYPVLDNGVLLGKGTHTVKRPMLPRKPSSHLKIEENPGLDPLPKPASLTFKDAQAAMAWAEDTGIVEQATLTNMDSDLAAQIVAVVDARVRGLKWMPEKMGSVTLGGVRGRGVIAAATEGGVNIAKKYKARAAWNREFAFWNRFPRPSGGASGPQLLDGHFNAALSPAITIDHELAHVIHTNIGRKAAEGVKEAAELLDEWDGAVRSLWSKVGSSGNIPPEVARLSVYAGDPRQGIVISDKVKRAMVRPELFAESAAAALNGRIDLVPESLRPILRKMLAAR